MLALTLPAVRGNKSSQGRDGCCQTKQHWWNLKGTEFRFNRFIETTMLFGTAHFYHFSMAFAFEIISDDCAK